MSTRTLTPARLAARQMRARWPSFVPTAIGVAAALALGVAVTLTQSRTDEASLVQAVNGLGSSGLVTVRLTGVRQLDAYKQFQRDVRVAVGQEHGLVTPRSTLLYSGVYTPLTINGAGVGSLGIDYARSVVPLQVAVLEDLQSHVELVAGSWPSQDLSGASIEATLPEAAAAGAHLKLGDTQCQKVLSPGTYITCFHVAAIWRPLNRAEPYWAAQAPPAAAFTDDVTYFTTIKAEADKDPQPQLVSVATVTLVPDGGAIRNVGADAALVDLRRLHAEFGAARPDAVVISNLETALDEYVAQRDVATFAVQLVAAQLLLVALYCLWVLAGTLLMQQRATTAVWRSRGWPWRAVSSLLFLELLSVAVLALPLGIVAGWAASEVAARFAYEAGAVPAFHLDVVKLGLPVAVILAVEVGILGAQAMLAAREGILATRSESSRPADPWWRQRYLDVALAFLAIPLLAASGFLGNASVRASAGSDDPLLLLLPGLAVALLAVASLRLLPPLAAAASRMRASTASRLASLQLLRASGQHAGLAVLLMLAVALGVFATTFIATAQKNGADRAAYQVGADVRGTFGGTVTTLPDEIPLRGVAARSSVFRGYAREANEDVSMIAVDAYSFKPVMYTRNDLASSTLPGLVQKLANDETGGLTVPSAAKTISIWVHGSGTGGTLTAHLADEYGREVHAELGSLDFSGWRQLSAPFVADTGAVGKQLRFRDLAISGVKTAGDIGLSSLAGGSVVLETFQEVITGNGAAFAPSLWWRTDWVTGARAENLLPSVDLLRNGARTVHFRVVPAQIPTYVRPNTTRVAPGLGSPSPGPVPALVSTQLLTRFGLSVGKLMQIEVEHVAMSSVIVGVVDHFPTLYPELGDFMVLPRDPMLIGLAYGQHQRPFANEIWVRAASGEADAAVQSMRAAPGAVTVLDRRAVEGAAAQSPQRLELASNLVLGFVAAAALGLLAFALHFLLLARTRLSDYAVLEANGMAQSVIRGSLLVEQAIVLAFCVVGGVVLGLVASAAILPGLQLGVSAADNVPQTIVTIDPALLALVLGAVIGGAALAGPLIAVSTERPHLMAELRALG